MAADFTKAALSPRERAIADHAAKITRAPDTCSPADLERLRTHGLSDDEILGLTGIVAYQNMSTRFMESLSTVD